LADRIIGECSQQVAPLFGRSCHIAHAPQTGIVMMPAVYLCAGRR
jgi:hypothetical protein